MNFDKYSEHMQDSAIDNSRFDGFCRGDVDNSRPENFEIVVGRMQSSRGTVEVVKISTGYDTDWYVCVDGRIVTDFLTHDRAIEVGRWWVKGCAA